MKEKKNLISQLLLVFSLIALTSFISGCTESNDDVDISGNPTASATPTSSAIPVEPGGNPVATGPQNFLDGPGGNLWKPVSDTTGNLVVVLENKWKIFSGGCTIEKKDGTKELLTCGGGFPCYANPDRLTLRSNMKCSSAKEVKVVCEELKQSVTFTVDASRRAEVCSRLD